MAESENNGNLPAGKNPEYIDSTDSLYLRVHEIASRLLTFYEKIATDKPEVLEEYLSKYPKSAAAKLRMASVIFSKVLPAKKQIQVYPNNSPKKRLPSTALSGLSIDQLKKLAGIKE